MRSIHYTGALAALSLTLSALVTLPAYALSVSGAGGGHGGIGVGGTGIGSNAGVSTNVNPGTGINAGATTDTNIDTGATMPGTGIHSGSSANVNAPDAGTSVNGTTDLNANDPYQGHAYRAGSNAVDSTTAGVDSRTHLDAGRTGALATGSANITSHNPGGSPSLSTTATTNTVIGH